MLKGDYDDSAHGALTRLATRSTFDAAMALVSEARPPAELSGLQTASPKDIQESHK